MEIGSIFLILAVILGVGVYIAQPFMERRGRRTTVEAPETSALLAERDRIVNALQELDFDYNLKKIPAEDYPVQRAELLQKGAEILKQLDALTPNSHPASPAKATTDRIESAVAARRADMSTEPSSPRDDHDVEALISTRRKGRKEKSGGFCPRCGKPVLVSDRFCPHCGKSIA